MNNWMIGQCESNFTGLFSANLLKNYLGYLYWVEWNGVNYPPLSLLAKVLLSYRMTSLALRKTALRSLQELFPAKSVVKDLQLEGSSKIEQLATELEEFPNLESVVLKDINLTNQNWNVGILTSLPIHQANLNNCNLSSLGVDEVLIALSETGRQKGYIDIRNNSAPSQAGINAAASLSAGGWKIYRDS